MFTTIDYLIWALSAIGNISVLLLMHRKQLNTNFPAFYRLITYKVFVRDIGMFTVLMLGNDINYFWAYWITAAISVAMYVPCIMEVFIFEKQTSRIALLFILVTVALFISISPAHNSDWLTGVVRSSEKALWSIVGTLFLWTIIDSPVFTSRAEIGIASGLAIYSYSSLIKTLIVSSFPQSAQFLRSLSPISYLISLTIWTYVLWNHQNSTKIITHSRYILLLQRLRALR